MSFSMSSRFRRACALSLVLSPILLIAMVFLALKAPVPQTYDFVKEDHPVDMWQEKGDRWSYYFVGSGTTEDLTASATEELSKLGFSLVEANAPWNRFANGNTEVVICNHDEFEVNVGVLNLKTGYEPPDRKFPCVLVKNGRGTDMSQTVFTIKKLVLGW